MARRKLRIDMVEEVEPRLAEPDPDESAMHGVGATLRAARERHGWNIPDVAQQLRIRPSVLEAMEAGRFEKLPNGAYALGFVRSYADFLGLDRDEISRRVKAEVAALSARTELVFPKPLTESRMPSAVVLVVSLVLAAGGYGLWYYHSAANVRLAAPRVDAVPPRLAAQVEPLKPSPRDAAAATVEEPSAPPVQPEAAKPSAAPSTAAAPSGAKGVAGAAPAPAAAPAAAAPTAAAPSAAAPKPAPSEAAPAAPQVASGPANSAPAAPAAADSKPAPAAKQYGDTDGSVRIVLKATADSWVQIRDHSGAILFSRILRPGDSYAVPNRPGLVMATGSAGALDIIVDGKTAPAIGRVGFTRKDVPLDPERLLDGTAVVENAHAHAPAKPSAKPAEAHEAAPSASPSVEPPAAAPSPPGGNG